MRGVPAWAMVVAALALDCSPAAHGPPRAAGDPVATARDAGPAGGPVTAAPIDDHCATDLDCALAIYPDPDDGGCCPEACGRPVVSRARAAAHRNAYQARCAAATCPELACEPAADPRPLCREGVCVAGEPLPAGAQCEADADCVIGHVSPTDCGHPMTRRQAERIARDTASLCGGGGGPADRCGRDVACAPGKMLTTAECDKGRCVALPPVGPLPPPAEAPPPLLPPATPP